MLLAGALAVLPLALLLAQNRGRIAAPQPILVAAAVTAVSAVAVTALLGRRLAPHVAAALVGAVGFVFYAGLFSAGSIGVNLLTWGSTAVVFAMVVIALIGDSRVMISAVAAVAGAVAIGAMTFGLAQTADPVDPPEALAFRGPVKQTPNVYLFLLDGFARPDIIESQLGDIDVDLQPSIDALVELGFELEEEATSNYPATLESFPSILNGTLHLTDETPLSLEERWVYAQGTLRGRNSTVSFLTEAGYSYWHSGSGLWDNATCDPTVADRCLGNAVSSFEASSALWELTPLVGILGKPNPDSVQDPVKVVDQILAAREAGETGPYFVFSHIMSPHHPYRFDLSWQAAQLFDDPPHRGRPDRDGLPPVRPWLGIQRELL